MEATASTRRPSMWYSFQPEAGGGEEKALHLGPAVVEDPGAPGGVLPLVGIAVLIAVGAVEFVEALSVLAEVGGHPVQQHQDAVLCMWFTNHMKSLGVPNREVGAKYPVHW